MSSVRVITAVLAVLLSSFIYYRSGILYTFYANAPGRLEKINNLGSYEVRFQHLLRNCEDAYLNDEEGWALLSCDPGRDEWNTVMGTFINPEKPLGTGLFLFRYADGPETTPDMVKMLPFEDGHRDFHPLGIDYHAPSKTLFVANHAFSGPKVEIYSFDPTTVSATLKSSLNESDGVWSPNSIHAVSDTEFFFTQDHHFRIRFNPVLAKIETYGGIPGGSVARMKLLPNGKSQSTTLARLSFPNGIAMLNSSTMAVASSSGASVNLYSLKNSASEGAPELTKTATIRLSFIPDNLSIDGRGNLLIAGHPHAPSLEEVAKTNRLCHDERSNCQLHRLSWIAEWSEEAGLKTLYAGDEFGTSTTAVRDTSRGIGFTTGLYEKGILVWKS